MGTARSVFLLSVTGAVLLFAWIANASVEGVATLDKLRYRLTDVPILTVTDADLNTSPTTQQNVTVNLSSTSDSNGISVTLREDGVNSSTFSNPAEPVDFSTGDSNDPANTLKVAAGDAVTLTYDDLAPAGARTATATMYADNATAAFTADRYALDDTTTLSVTDIDANTSTTTAQTLSIDLESSTGDTTGISVILTETGVNSSTFTGTATFTGSGSSNNTTDVLRVGTGDTLTLTYTENLFDGTNTAARTDTATVQQNGSATLDKLRYALTDVPTLTVTDPDENTDAGTTQTVDVRFTSTTDATGITVTLTESGADTGVFNVPDDAVAFAGSGSSNDAANTLLAAEGATVTLTYAEDTTYQGPDQNRTDTATMNVTGVASLDKLHYALDETATLRVIDMDRNTAPGSAQSVDVNIASTADPMGFPVTLTEDGNDTGTFENTVTFNEVLSNPVTHSLEVGTGDTVTLTYDDDDPPGTRTATATMFVNGATAAFDADRYALDDTATLTVTDIDVNTDAASVQTLTVNLKSSTDATGISVTLTETDADDSTFTGTATFTGSGSSNNTTDVLLVGTGGTLTLTYTENLFDGASTAARTDPATMQQNGSAVLDKLRYALTDVPTLTVTDPDENTSSGSTQTVDVSFTSTTDATGITVTLTESGADTGVFNVPDDPVAFRDTGSSDDAANTLWVSRGDTVTLTYAEDTTYEGPDQSRTATATVFADTATAGFGLKTYDLNDTATVRVADADGNLDAGLAETVTATVSSTSDGTGFSVTLTETGNNAGVFENTITFTTGSSNPGSRILKVAEGDTVTASYDEPNASGSGTTARTGTATMFTDNATVSLDQTRYAVNEDPVITVTDADRNGDASSAEEITAKLSSSTNGAGIDDITLTETGVDTGIFKGSVGLTTASSATELQVAEGDLLTATYLEPKFDGGGNTTRTANAETTLDGVAFLDASTYDLNDTATLGVTDADENTSGSSKQSFDVTLTSTTDAVGITVTLTETGNNSGTFTRTVTFTDTDSSSGTTLEVSRGGTVTLTYVEDTTFLGPNADRTDTATMFADTATATLDALRYDFNDTATPTVTDVDANTSATTAQTLSVNLDSPAGDPTRSP